MSRHAFSSCFGGFAGYEGVTRKDKTEVPLKNLKMKKTRKYGVSPIYEVKRRWELSIIIILLPLLFATSCGGNKSSSVTSEIEESHCVITSEFKKQIKKMRKYEHFQDVQDGLFLVRSKETKNDAKGFSYHPYGCVDKDGHEVIPTEYRDARKGPEVICVQNKDYKWGMLNLNGDEIAPFIYDIIGVFYGNYTIVKQNNKYGILNNGGELAVPVKYDHISHFYGAYYHTYGHENSKFEDVFYLTNNGKETLLNLSRSNGAINREHFDTPFDYQVLKLNEHKFVIVDYLGNETTPYQNVQWGSLGGSSSVDFSEGLAAVVINNKIGFIDKNGNVKIPFQFEYSEFWFNYNHHFGVFSEGVATMRKSGKWGYIDKNGNTVIPYMYTHASCFHKGVAAVGKLINNEVRFGLIDKHNNVVLPFEFESCRFSSSIYSPGSVYVVSKNSKWGVYSPAGVCITSCQYDRIDGFFGGYATVVKDGKQGLLDEHNHLLIPCEYEACLYDARAKVVYVVKDGKQGILDLNNQIIVPTEFDQVGVYDYTKANLFFVEKKGERGLFDLCGNYVKIN